jgi:glycine/sarcosine/betaine reductase selenoprotein B
MRHVRYIDKTREYYASEGYTTPYRWARFDTVPFRRLRRPLRECRVGLVSTSELAVRGEPTDPDKELKRQVYALPTDVPVERLVSLKAAYDRYATTLDDVDAYLPLTHLRQLVADGRLGSLAPRFQVVYSEYSQRKTMTVDAEEIVRQCREDAVDVVLLSAV